MKQINNAKAGEGEIKMISEMLKDKQVSLLAHCIRAERTDPLRIPILRMTDSRLIEIPDKRVGRPRVRWVDEAFKSAFEKISPNRIFDKSKFEHQDVVILAAKNREI